MADSSTATGTTTHEAPAEEEIKPSEAGESDTGSPDGQSDANADSSAAPEGDAKKTPSLADAVRAALEPKKEQSSGSGEEEGNEPGKESESAEGKKPKDGEEEELGELTEEELNSYKPKTRRRIEKLTEQVKALQGRVEQEAPELQNYRTIQGFVRKAGLSKEEVNTGFQMMNLFKNDPVKGYEAFLPIWTQLCSLVGVVLPEDLNNEVKAGKMTPERAQELSRLRAGRTVNTNIEQQRSETEKQERQRQAAESGRQLSASVGQAITDWEARWKASDPDFSLKSSRVTEAIAFELSQQRDLAMAGKQNSLPRSVEESIAFANRVKKRVEDELKTLLPKRNKSITPVTGNGVTQGSKPVAKNMYDVVAQAVGHR